MAVGSVGLRADRLKSYIGSSNRKQNDEKIFNLIKKLVFDKSGKIIEFEDFNKLLKQEIFGIVLTAHPTFGMTYQMMQDLAKLATSENEKGKKISNKELKIIIKDIFKTEQRPEKNISLDFEHSLSISALKNLQLSLKVFIKLLLFAKKFYPKKYHEIYPQILRLHTWVGYDVDGRGDIFWNNTFSKRLQVKIEQLIIYCSSISDLLKKPCCKPTQKKLFF